MAIDRIQIKTEAKALVRDNWWYLFKPLLVVFLANLIVELIGRLGSTSELAEGVLVETFDGRASIISLVLAILVIPLSVGILKYYVDFVRTKKQTDNMMGVLLAPYKNWLTILVTTILTFLAVVAGTILLVIPGIILGIGLVMTEYILAEGKEKDPIKIMRDSWAMMKGHKMDYLIFMLSFIGWGILMVFTLGILGLWLIPYMSVATAMFYLAVAKDKK